MRKVLVIQIARFGDLIQTKRLLLSLARDCEVHICVDKSLAALANLVFPRTYVHGLVINEKLDYELQKENERVFGELAGIGFEQIYNCNFTRLSSAICRLFEKERITGYRPLDHSAGGLTRSFWARLVFRVSRMRALASLNLVDYWAWFANNPVPGNAVNPDAKGGGKGLGIVIGGREQRRSLPENVLGTIAEVAYRRINAPNVYIFGTREQIRQSQRLQRHFSREMLNRTVDLTGKTDWKQLIAEMNGLDLVLSPDTGSMHLAAHMGVPVMAFFLSSALCHETGPYGAGHTIWQVTLDCSPCLESSPCNRNTACLNPFKEPSFLRSLALSFEEGKVPVPEGMQCWRTGFDDLGTLLGLRGGEDIFKTQREMIRNILKDSVRLSHENSTITPYKSDTPLLTELIPDSEWMLPPWRYS